jgi:phage terminase small subunit
MATFGNNSRELTPQQVKAIAYLLSSKDVKSAARSAGIAYTTLNRWLQNDEFQKALRKAENQVVDGAVRRIVNASSKALDYLENLLGAEAANENNRVRAALALVEWSVDIRTRNDLAIIRSQAADLDNAEWFSRELAQAASEARLRLMKQSKTG